jgi:EAL domain-containing protein (putative c-di-GMP-specific phosphodiesterase class I)
VELPSDVALQLGPQRLQPCFQVAGLLARWELPAQLLVVEITESTIMADPTHALEISAGSTPCACR